jgi:glycosyltransferase involved in cell wall biosynthesis
MRTTPYRIGIDARFFRSSTAGIGTYTRELLHHLFALDQVNQYVVFITPADVAEWDIAQKNVQCVVTSATHFTYAEQTIFLKELLQAKLDLVHFLNFNHPILYTKPFIATLQDFTVYYHPVGRSQKSRLRRAAFIATLKHSLTAARLILPISQNSANDAKKVFGIPEEKMQVVYEGGPDQVALPTDAKERVHGCVGDASYFLFVSAWRPHKGLITLLEGYRLYRESGNRKEKLVLVGNQKAATSEMLDALAQHPFRDDIITPGFISQETLDSLYGHTTAFVMPSEYEGFGLGILEAFAHHAPVITADNSSLPELGGDAVAYFETRNAASLADMLQKVATHPHYAEELRTKGGKQLQKFSWDKCAQETLEAYYKILATTS